MLKRRDREVKLFGRHYYWTTDSEGRLTLYPAPTWPLLTRDEVAAWLAREAGLSWVR